MMTMKMMTMGDDDDVGDYVGNGGDADDEAYDDDYDAGGVDGDDDDRDEDDDLL